MSDDWFTEEGATGELTIQKRDGSWIVADSRTSENIICLLGEGIAVDDSADSCTIEGTVSSYRPSHGKGPSFLHLSGSQNTPTTSNNSGRSNNQLDRSQEPENPLPRSRKETWDLEEFSGSGEYVNVEATIEAILDVKKGEPHSPDLKGYLMDDTVRKPVYFIVEQGVTHPYFEHGTRFRFENVKDHFYKERGQTQVLINEHTKIIELD